MVDPEPEVEDLAADAMQWAEQNGYPLDGEWLESVLRIYSMRIDSPTAWPKDSVTELVARYLPAYGHGPRPEPQAIKETLTTYWRFLKLTGLMAPGSRQPSKLTAELSAALPRMIDRWDDRRFWSHSRVLAEFGDAIGLSFTEAESQADLEKRVAAVNAAWNAQPQEERWRLMPDPHPDAATPPYSGGPTDFIGDGSLPGEGDGMPTDADIEAMRADPEQAGQEVAASEFTRKCEALAEWVGDGRAVTSTGVLRPAVAREAIEALDLRDPNGREHTWRSAADYYPLDRVWRGCLSGHLIKVTGSKAVGVAPDPDVDILGHGLMRTIPVFLEDLDYGARPLFGLLVNLMQLPRGETLPLDQVYRWYAERDLADWGHQLSDADTRLARRIFEMTLKEWDDLGLFARDAESIAITEFGREFIFTLMALDEQGAIDLETEMREY